MSAPLIRMTKEDRQLIAKHMKHKRREFEEELRGRILAYLNKLIERKKLQPELDEYHQFNLDQKQKQIDKVVAATSAAQSLTGQSSSNVATAANIVAGTGGAIATKALNHQVESLKVAQAEEKIHTAQMSVYISKQQDEIAERVAAILSYRFQFLILRLAGGNNGYILLANVMADAIESNAIEKLRGRNSRIDALVDAAIPQTDSLHYKGWFNIRNCSVLKTLEIDQEINKLAYRVGPAVRSFIGKPKTKPTYQIVDVLNYPFIINGQGEILSGSQRQTNINQSLNGENKLPVLLLASNEQPSQLGFDHGTYVTGHVLEQEQVIALLRLSPNFFKDEIKHYIEPIKTEEKETKARDTDNESFADLVFPEELYECPWTLDRDELWRQRTLHINKNTSSCPETINASIAIDAKGLERRQESYIFDAKQAEKNLKEALKETTLSFNNLSQASSNNIDKQNRQNKAVKSAHYVTLAAQQLIRCAAKLDTHIITNGFLKDTYLQSAKNALRTANETLESIRNSPLTEFRNSFRMQSLVKQRLDIYNLWTKHIKLTHNILDDLTYIAEQRQEPNAIKKFVYYQKWHKYNLTKKFIIQGEINSKMAYDLLEQAKCMTEYSHPQTDKESNIATFAEENNKEIQSIKPLDQNREPNNSSQALALTPSTLTLQPTVEQETNKKTKSSSSEESKDDEEILDLVGPPAAGNLIAEEPDELPQKYGVKKQLLSIEGYRNDIEKTHHAIFSFLEIDTLQNNETYYKKKNIKLKRQELLIAHQASSALKIALKSYQDSKEQKDKALKPHLYYYRNTARTTISISERAIKSARKDIITCLSNLESYFNTNNNTHFHAATVAARNRNFKFLINQIFPENSSIPPIIQLQLMEKEAKAKQYEYTTNLDNSTRANDIYDKTIEKIIKFGTAPYSLNTAFQYARLLRQTKDKIIHITTGDIAATVTLSNQAQHLQFITEQLKSNAKSVQQDIHQLTKECISLLNDNEGKSEAIIYQEKPNCIIGYKEACRKLETLINHLTENRMVTLKQPTSFSKPNTYLQQDKESNNLIYSTIINIISYYINNENDDNNEDKPISIKKSTQEKVFDSIINKLNEKKYYVELAKYSINWGLWAVSIAANIVIKHDLTQVESYINSSIQISSLESLNSPTEIMLLQTKQQILSVYRELASAEFNNDIQIDNQTLSSSQEQVKDKLKWASNLNHQEQKWVERHRKDASRSAQLMVKQNSIIPYQTPKKTDPIRLLHHQLLNYCTQAIEKRKVMVNQFQGCLNELCSRRRIIEHENMLSKNKKEKNKEITDLINTIDKLIRDKINRIDEVKEDLNTFKSSLLKDTEKLRVYFRDWKRKTPEPLESNARLKAITDATAEKNKKRLEAEEAKRQAQKKANPKNNEEKEDQEEIEKEIDRFQIKDIKKLMKDLSNKISDRNNIHEEPSTIPPISPREQGFFQPTPYIYQRQNSQPVISSNERIPPTPPRYQVPPPSAVQLQQQTSLFAEGTSLFTPDPKRQSEKQSYDEAIQAQGINHLLNSSFN